MVSINARIKQAGKPLSTSKLNSLQ